MSRLRGNARHRPDRALKRSAEACLKLRITSIIFHMDNTSVVHPTRVHFISLNSGFATTQKKNPAKTVR